MKKWLVVVFLSFVLFPKNVFAEIKLDNNGNYYVQKGYCTYETTYKSGFGDRTYKFRINIKDAEFSNIEFIGENKLGDYGDFVHIGSLKYSTFFTNKKFSCPSIIYVDYSASDKPLGYRMQSSCDEENIGTQCNIANVVTSEMSADYEELGTDEQQTEIKEEDFVCSYVKTTSTSGGSAIQNESPEKMIYKKYKDGSQMFYSGKKAYEVLEGSIGNCEDIQIYLKAVSEGKHIKGYKILNSCSDGTDEKCVTYGKENTYNNTDSSLNDDGTSENASELADPDLVQTSIISSDIDLNIANGCNSYLGSPDKKTDPAYYLSFAFDLMKYAAILILFGMTVADFAKAMATKEDEFKKALQKAIKRFIIAVLIFFLPQLVEFLFEMFGIYTDPSCLVKN